MTYTATTYRTTAPHGAAYGEQQQQQQQNWRERLAEGTEELSEAARARVIAARERAVEARREAIRAARRGGQAAGDFFERQPLVAGALAFAAGAAIAALLPRTRLENEYLGQYSDDLIRQAEDIYAEEKERAKAAVNTAVAEARDMAQEAVDRAKDAVPTEDEVEARAKAAAKNTKAAAEDAETKRVN